MKIAVLGMGRMGQALAGRLQDSGHQLVIWNRTSGKAPELARRGAIEAESLTAALHDADLAITSLANDDAVRQVALGTGGVRESLPRDSVYVDASTVAPSVADDLDAAFAHFAAMPVLGSPAAVSAGRATYLLGAPDATAQALDPLLRGLSDRILHYDRPSLAQAAKLAVNLLLLDNVVALAESFAVGRAGGLSDQQLRALLSENPMVAPGLGNRFDGILTGEQDPWWTAALGAKDAGLAIDLAAAGGSNLSVTAAARARYLEVAATSETDDIAMVTKLYRRHMLSSSS